VGLTVRIAFIGLNRDVLGTMPASVAQRRSRTVSVPETADGPMVAFFGNFGTRNLGNEYTLRAIVDSARAYVPGIKVMCVCTNAGETTATHHIPAVPISDRLAPRAGSGDRRRDDNPLLRLARRVVVRAPLELVQWVKAYRALRATTMLVMTGTGMLSDFGIGPFDLHYEILKWSIVAKLRHCKLLFVSVGVGPIADARSRWIVKRALGLADYRSYRDRFSRQYLESIGFDTSRDHVYPDLVFSLAEGESPLSTDRPPRRPVVGLGLMDYYGQHVSPAEGERIYQRFLDGLARFASWLLAHGYTVRLLVGDLSYDRRIKGDLLELLDVGQRSDAGLIIDEPLLSAEQLDRQIGQTDLVVATRFHNVLVSLLRGKPVIALSYHAKVRSLMAEAGLDEFCQDADPLDVDRLIELFQRLESRSEELRGSMRRMAETSREALREQYRHIFGDLASAA
jgi:polysaccharide pyruvyl transferase WcaK-like protein